MKPCVYLAGLCVLVGLGCDHGPSNPQILNSGGSTSSSARETGGDVSGEVQLLLDNPSIESLNAILSKQGVSLPDGARLGSSSAWRGLEVKDPVETGIVNSIFAVQSFGRQYVVAPVIFDKPGSENAGRYWTDAVFVLNETGELVKRLGGVWAPDGINGDEITVTSLGTKGEWFVVISRFEQHEPFGQITDIYMIAPDVPLAVRMYHDANSMRFSVSPKETLLMGRSRIAFRGKNREMQETDKGEGSDGSKHPPVIEWLVKSRKFRGPSYLSFHGHPILKVDTESSHAFQATDAVK